MKKKVALLAITGAVLVFTVALVAFSVYTVYAVNAGVASTTVAPSAQPVTMNSAVTRDSATLTDVASDNADSVEVSVQHIGTECHGDNVGD